MLLLPLAGMAQTTGGHPVNMRVINNKGEAPRRDIIAYVKSENPVVHSFKEGRLTLPGVANNDTVAVIIRHRIYEFPANGMTTLQLNLNRRDRVASAWRNGEKIAASDYKVVPASASSPDVQVDRMTSPLQYANLADYLTGRIAGLVIDGGPGYYQAYLDGVVPLVVVNGIRMQDFNAANMLVNPNDIESVTVDRNGVIYGAAGMNGVLVIDTK
jgi:hypothetical protein